MNLPASRCLSALAKLRWASVGLTGFALLLCAGLGCAALGWGGLSFTLGLSWALFWHSWGSLGSLLGLAWPLLGSLGALLGLSEALLGLSWRAKPFYCKPFTLHFLWSCSFPWAGMGLAHFAQLAELSKGCNGLGWAGLSKGCTGLG